MFNEKKWTRRVTDEPLLFCHESMHGFVPRDYFNPELRHHQMLNIAFIA